MPLDFFFRKASLGSGAQRASRSVLQPLNAAGGMLTSHHSKEGLASCSATLLPGWLLFTRAFAPF